MATAIAERLFVTEVEKDIPLGFRVLAVWAGLRALPMVGFVLYLLAETVQNLSAAGFWGSLLSLSIAAGLLAYAAYAGITAISLWTASPLGIQGTVGLGALGWVVGFLFLGTENPAWLLGFIPELYPLALLGVHEISLAAMFVLINVATVVPIWYVFHRRQAFQ